MVQGSRTMKLVTEIGNPECCCSLLWPRDGKMVVLAGGDGVVGGVGVGGCIGTR